MIRRLPSSPIWPTVVALVVLYVAAGLLYEGFFSIDVLVGLLAENAFLGIAAVGMTFVILSGGIDLSVGAVLGCSSIVIAVLVEEAGWHPAAAAALAVGLGALLGGGMGAVIHGFGLPAFIVTLAGMFLARGIAFVVHEEAIAIRHPVYPALYDAAPAALPVTLLLVLAVAAAGQFVARWTPFGRTVYAVGGDETSARLMGLAVGRAKIGVYAISGGCAGLAGAVFTLYTFSGSPTAGTMLELDAIAAVVIGGTLLSGGVGSVTGTLLGVLIFGVIQTAIIFDGRLSSWWTRIAIGVLLLLFLVVQRVAHRTLGARAAA